MLLLLKPFTPQKVTSSDSWEGTALSEMVEHYLNTVKESKTGTPEEKKQAEGAHTKTEK